MISASQIREVVSGYLSDGDADKFVLNFSALSHNIHKNGDAEAVALAAMIESKMADFHGKFISVADFSDFLRSLINPFVMNISVPVMIFNYWPRQLCGGGWNGIPGMGLDFLVHQAQWNPCQNVVWFQNNFKPIQ
jgi:hypothetical protein